MKSILILLFILICNISKGQSIEIDTLNQDTRIYGIARISYDTIVKKYPSADNFNYPNWAFEIQNRIDTNNFSTPDKIGVALIISKKGELEKITILKGHNNDCIVEAIRVIKSLKKWTPALYEFYPSENTISTYKSDFTINLQLNMRK
jgi:hypothetical protein